MFTGGGPYPFSWAINIYLFILMLRINLLRCVPAQFCCLHCVSIWYANSMKHQNHIVCRIFHMGTFKIYCIFISFTWNSFSIWSAFLLFFFFELSSSSSTFLSRLSIFSSILPVLVDNSPIRLFSSDNFR
jgi:hypothetical protein